ncbi:hypothetical protein HHI36_017743 [Cryptolaemus montrouzieri]|uniref:SCP domain-containing protein n=1 Tax=Cryptolaemus montrouzieri TaxID=559131 RepID=A0ABD2NNF3_9CUCU
MNAVQLFVILIICFVGYGSPTCHGGVYEQGLSQNDRNFIVNKHNHLRGLVAQGRVEGQPRATNMKTMHYSNILERKAQEVANTCEFRHVTITGTPWSWVGQNLFLHLSSGYGKGPNWDEAINSWFNEHRLYRFGAPFSAATGHYTQLVWANTDHVGCGYTYYPKGGGYKYQKLYVCNYGPGGNYIGQAPYRT